MGSTLGSALYEYIVIMEEEERLKKLNEVKRKQKLKKNKNRSVSNKLSKRNSKTDLIAADLISPNESYRGIRRIKDLIKEVK